MLSRNIVLGAALLGGVINAGVWAGPYAPPAGQGGSTAVYMGDPNIVGWADGWEDYLVGPNSFANWQDPQEGLGPAEGSSFDIVCLGIGGEITLTFSCGIGDGVGCDFAVFENALTDTFLELAYVEVSSDGEHFFRFDNDSLTADPVGPFGPVDATDVDGLAGKFRQGYGTAFDLAQLRYVSSLLDVNNVMWVRLVDIVGDGSYLDTSGDVIYDPYPTSGSAGAPGFDLDAIAVLNMRTGDFNQSGNVDAIDMTILSEAWLSGPGQGNWDTQVNISDPYDTIIDFLDYSQFARQWLAGN